MEYKGIDITKWENGCEFQAFSEAYMRRIIEQTLGEGIVFVYEEDTKTIQRLNRLKLSIRDIAKSMDMDTATVEAVLAGKWNKPIHLEIRESANYQAHYKACWEAFLVELDAFDTSFNMAVIEKFMGKPSDFLYEKIMQVWSNMCTYLDDDCAPIDRLKERIDQMDSIAEIVFIWFMDKKEAERNHMVQGLPDDLGELPVLDIAVFEAEGQVE